MVHEGLINVTVGAAGKFVDDNMTEKRLLKKQS